MSPDLELIGKADFYRVPGETGGGDFILMCADTIGVLCVVGCLGSGVVYCIWSRQATGICFCMQICRTVCAIASGWVVGGVIVRRSPMVRRDRMFDFAFGHIPVITCHWLDGRWICWWLPGTWYDDGNVCVTCGVIGSAVGHDISLQGRRIVVGRLHFDGIH